MSRWRHHLAGLLLAASALPALACTKTVRWNDDGPYYYQAADGTVSGFSAALTRELLRRIGCDARFVKMPWARALVELEAGHLDMLAGAIVTPERQRFAYFSRVMGQSQNVLFMSTEAAARYKVRSLADLSGSAFRLGVQIGVTYGDDFDALNGDPAFRNLLKPVSARMNAWRMINMGRLDGIIADVATGMQELRTLGLAGAIQPTDVAVKTAPATYAFSKRTTTPELIQRFDQAYATMLADGSHQKLVEQYLPGVPFKTR